MSVVQEKPEPTPEPSTSPGAVGTLKENTSRLGRKFTTQQGWLGDYDYAWLCLPSLPCARGRQTRRPPPFFPLDADMPLVLAIACGLQHALAMLAGLITPPIIFASELNLDTQTSAYMISASLIGCGA
jgi:hypothetical protein